MTKRLNVMEKIESNIKVIAASQEKVYQKMSDLNNLETVKNYIPKDKIQDVSFDADSIKFSISPVGEIVLKIIERDPCKCIKFQAEKSPLPFNLWIQIVAVNDTECKVKLTAGLEVNPFMKGMVKKPVKDGLDKLVEMFAAIQY